VFLIYHLLLRLRLNHDDGDDDWLPRRVYQPPKRPPPHPDMPSLLDASYYPTTRRVTTETADAAAGEKQGSRAAGLETRQVSRPMSFFVLFFNTILITIYDTRLCPQRENDASNRHDDEVWGSRRVLVCLFLFLFLFSLSTAHHLHRITSKRHEKPE
jgi:hypothetical protein